MVEPDQCTKWFYWLKKKKKSVLLLVHTNGKELYLSKTSLQALVISTRCIGTFEPWMQGQTKHRTSCSDVKKIPYICWWCNNEQLWRVWIYCFDLLVNSAKKRHFKHCGVCKLLLIFKLAKSGLLRRKSMNWGSAWFIYRNILEYRNVNETVIEQSKTFFKR